MPVQGVVRDVAEFEAMGRGQGVHPKTADRWYREARLRFRPRGGTTDPGGLAPPGTTGQVVGEARGSSADQRADLDRQGTRVTAWATGEGLAVSRVVTEVGSALNGKRKRLLALLRDPTARTILVEHRDRFARFGAEEVEAALAAQGGA